MIGFFQVPRSTKKLYEDNEYALYTVTLFSRVADNFRTSAREKGFQVSLFFLYFILFLCYPKSSMALLSTYGMKSLCIHLNASLFLQHIFTGL